MASELKTTKNAGSVSAFLATVENPQRRRDAQTMIRLMRKVTGKRATMWGDSIVGFGSYHYRNASGREANWFLTGVSPRKQALTVYIMPGFSEYGDLLRRLGKHKTGRSCLYINKLEDVDLEVLERLIEKSVEYMVAKYG